MNIGIDENGKRDIEKRPTEVEGPRAHLISMGHKSSNPRI
jgi:hypothetical protein